MTLGRTTLFAVARLKPAAPAYRCGFALQPKRVSPFDPQLREGEAAAHMESSFELAVASPPGVLPLCSYAYVPYNIAQFLPTPREEPDVNFWGAKEKQ